MTTQTEALKLAREGVEIHSHNSPEYIVCAALIEALAQPEQEPVGVMVSMDVSKGDEPEYRIFGRIYEVQRDGEGWDEVTYLAIEESRNFDITPPQRKPLTDAQLEKGRGQTFSINNPFCPCDSKTFRKVARWVEAAHDIKE